MMKCEFIFARCIGRAAYRETLPQVPYVAAAWNLQRSFLHLAGITLHGVPAGAQDRWNHTTYGGYKQAGDLAGC